MTRGVEDRPSGWVYAEPAHDFTAVREEGVAVVLLDRGLRHDVEETSPWLLAGLKTVSFAVHLAALREARRRGADDAVFVSSDGLLLEGATSSLLVRSGGLLWTPGARIGVLDGTTQANAFRYAESLGLETGHRLAGPAELESAEAAWLVSSVRRAVPIRAVDGRPLPVDREFTAGLNEFLAGIRE
jgi:4-amino-4-deoxychorismate lyase